MARRVHVGTSRQRPGGISRQDYEVEQGGGCWLTTITSHDAVEQAAGVRARSAGMDVLRWRRMNMLRQRLDPGVIGRSARHTGTRCCWRD